MDEDSNQTSRSGSQALDLHDEESKHRESDSQMTLTYGGSDSELNDDDTLRIDDSDGNDDESSRTELDKTPGPLLPASPFGIESVASKQGELPEKASMGDSYIEENVDFSLRNRKKVSQLIDSDSEEEHGEGGSSVRKVCNVIDSDESDQPNEEPLNVQNKDNDQTEDKIGNPMSRLKSLIDSDSASPAKDSDEECTAKKTKKLKTKKERGHGKTSEKKSGANDLLASLNLSFSDDESRPAKSDKDSGSNDSGSDSETGASNQKRSPNKKPQRMSAKTAMEQMQVIQSESQRMAREAAVSVPYHRPKQHTLQEFLSRRTVFKSAVGLNTPEKLAAGRRKAITAIKMTPEQLAAYAKQLEEREKEALEFFKNEEDKKESEVAEQQCHADGETKTPEGEINNKNAIISAHSEENNSNSLDDRTSGVDYPLDNTQDANNEILNTFAPIDTELGESLRVTDTEEDALQTSINETNQNVETALASQTETVNAITPIETIPVEMDSVSESTKTAPEIDYDPFSSEPTPSKLAQKKAELLMGGTFKTFPILKGDADMVIDLNSGDIGPKTPSGPELLLQRFSKCSGKKAQKAASLNILSTDKGVVELSTIKLGLEQEDRDPNGKEPIPGAAYTKLKQSLWEKMEQARRESILKRLQDTPEAKKIDDEEDEEVLTDDEVAEEEEEEEAEDCEDDDEKKVKTKSCDFLDDEAKLDDDDHEDNDAVTNQTPPAEDSNEEEDDESSDEEDSEPELKEKLTNGGEKKKSRIIAAFEDSDEEDPMTKTVEAKSLESKKTDELFSTFEDNDKFTPSDRNNIETGESMNLLWKDTEEQETTNPRADEEDLLALCSGRFGETQATLPQSLTESFATTQAMTTTPSELNLTESDRLTEDSERPTTTDALFTQRVDEQVDDNELIALCSGTFATQGQMSNLETERPIPLEMVAKGKLLLVSSDEEDQQKEKERKKKNKRLRRNINISDDEESDVEPDEQDEGSDDEVVEDEEKEDELEKFVDYDSEENEVEVVLTKKDKEKVAKTFVENEAELSESEWGSADEDEKDLDRYDIELGDEEKFDQNKLQEELERIHMRRILEQDKKEVKTLQDMFFEDEEKDGVGRERQFKWRNVETTFSLDYDKQGGDEQKEEDEDSDGETEAQWRKMRFEREMLLKEKKIDLDAINLDKSLVNENAQEDGENNSGADNHSTLVTKRRITVVRHSETIETTNKPQESCFLIKRSTQVSNKASFLSRDPETLKKLVNLVKVNPEADGVNTATTGKGRNFVFTSISPAVNQTGSKRSSDAADLNESSNSAKKVKTIAASSSKDDQSKKRLLLAKLM
ncbi:claspin [Armigeres subalbatus]|uniref:claspin n=1 Tax=Armigeres subalbatus TaxID=124917 RepID=UPI002ED664BA